MRMLDTNILLYSIEKSLPQHAIISPWFESLFASGEQVGMAWESLLGFARLVSNRKLFPKALSVSEAWEQVEKWLSVPTVWVPKPTEQHHALLAELITLPGITHRQIHDAHLAAIAIEHGLIFCSTDTDYARFPQLRWENPLGTASRVKEPREKYKRAADKTPLHQISGTAANSDRV